MDRMALGGGEGIKANRKQETSHLYYTKDAGKRKESEGHEKTDVEGLSIRRRMRVRLKVSVEGRSGDVEGEIKLGKDKHQVLAG